MRIYKQLLAKARYLLSIWRNKGWAFTVFMLVLVLVALKTFCLPGRLTFLTGQQFTVDLLQVPRGMERSLPGNRMEGAPDCCSKQSASGPNASNLGCAGYSHAQQIQTQDMLRFHVRAHSNSPRDQEIKNLVAQRVLVHYQQEWSNCRNSDELAHFLTENRVALEEVAREIMRDYGCAYDVEASLSRDVFPARCYEGRLFPAGEYTALYLIMGEGRGENWWCVLFPPLCFSSISPLVTGDEEQKQEDGKQEGLLTGGSAGGKNTGADYAPAAAGKKNSKKAQKKDSVDLVEQEKPSYKWRFWLWDVITKKRRR